jgi:hypothetical protein
MPTPVQLEQALAHLAQETDANARALLLAALVSELFRAEGFDPVVVGGSAIEFYTDGAYLSGDTDICWNGLNEPTPRDRVRIMTKLPGAEGNLRTWKVAGQYIDLLGRVITYAEKDYVSLQTPWGEVALQPVEDLLVERIFAATLWTGPNAAAEACAQKLLINCLQAAVPTDWAEVQRLANLPAYACWAEVRKFTAQIAARLKLPNPYPADV